MKRKIFHGLLALLFACGFWVYVITVDNPNDEITLYDVPVALAGESFLHDRGLMLSTQETPSITLTLSGNRSNLKKVNKSNITVVADLSKIADSGEQLLNYEIIFPGDVPDNAIKVESRLPDRVSVAVEGRTTKSLEVKWIYSGKVKPGYTPDKNSLELNQKFISATGPTAILSKIGSVQVTVDLEGRDQNIVNEAVEYVFCDLEGKPMKEDTVDTTRLKLSATEVKLSMKIPKLKEIQLIVDVIYGGGATEENTTVTQDFTSIEVSGSEHLLEELESLHLGTIDLRQELQDVIKTFAIELPEGLTNVTGVTEVQVDVKFEGIVVKNLTLEEPVFRKENAPKDMNVTFKQQKLQVALRGPAELLDDLLEENIIIYVDFTDAEPGGPDQFENYPAVIKLRRSGISTIEVGTCQVMAAVIAVSTR